MNRVDQAIRVITNTGQVYTKQARAIIGALIANDIVQWPTEPRIISNLPDLTGLPVGSVVRCSRTPFDTDVVSVFHRDDVAWWAAGSDEPWAVSDIPLPVEVLA